MTTVALTSSPTTLDPGTAYELFIVNSGSSIAHIQINSGLLFDERLNVGQSIRVPTGGNAVTAYVRSGSGQVTVTVTASNPQGDPAHESGQLDAATARGTYALLTTTPTLEELERGAFVSASVAATTTVRLGPFMQDQRVGSFALNVDTTVSAASETSYWTVNVRRLRGTSSVQLARKTTKATGGATMTADTAWEFDAVDWSPADRLVRKGDILAVEFAMTGTPPALSNVTAGWRYEPAVRPTVLDTFTRADSTTTLGTTESGGLTWQSWAGTFGISSNQAAAQASIGTGTISVVNVGSADSSGNVRIPVLDVANGNVLLRGVDANNYYYVNNNSIRKVVAGVDTSVQGLAIALTSGTTVSWRESGTTLYLYVGGALAATMTDATITGGRFFGLRATTTVPRYDDFSVV